MQTLAFNSNAFTVAKTASVRPNNPSLHNVNVISARAPTKLLAGPTTRSGANLLPSQNNNPKNLIVMSAGISPNTGGHLNEKAEVNATR